jgi:hypothetical protein
MLRGYVKPGELAWRYVIGAQRAIDKQMCDYVGIYNLMSYKKLLHRE